MASSRNGMLTFGLILTIDALARLLGTALGISQWNALLTNKFLAAEGNEVDAADSSLQ